MKKYILAIVSVFIIGCGSGGTESPFTENTNDIIIQRGPVIGAYVVDNQGKRAVNIGDGTYRFSTSPSYPISTYGGYIDVNRDGIIDGLDTALTIPMSTSHENGTVITILTTLAQNSAIKNELLATYSITEEELYSLVPAQSFTISAISNSVFEYCIQNNISIEEIDLITMQSFESIIKAVILNNQLSSQNMLTTITQNEIDLVKELNIYLTENEVISASETIVQSSTQDSDIITLVETSPLSTLTQEQENGLIFLYQEEKVARDVYIELYNLWGLTIFTNIAKAEQSHMDAVKTLLIKYDIAVPVLNDALGVFEDEALQNMYDSLITQGSISSNEALKVGKLIEETDIVDLQEKMIDAPEEITLVYQNLLNGSYNHLNAFTKQITQ